MNGPLITVIIPVYNVENYLSECLDSVLNQTYENIEVFLVDDGSVDRSGIICDEYSSRDKRIKVIHKNNTGAAASRNIGIKHAKGEYVLFCDSDDILNKELIKKLFKLIQKCGAQIAICDVKPFEGSFLVDTRTVKRDLIIMNNKEAIRMMLYQKHFDTGPCGKLIKKEIVDKHFFPEGKRFEDLFVIYKYLDLAELIVYDPEPLYYYRQRENSTMHDTTSISIFDEYDAINDIENNLKQKYPDLLPAVYSRKFSSSCQLLGWIPLKEKNRHVKDMEGKLWKFIHDYRWKMLFDKDARLKNKAAALISFLGKELTHFILSHNKINQG